LRTAFKYWKLCKCL